MARKRPWRRWTIQPTRGPQGLIGPRASRARAEEDGEVDHLRTNGERAQALRLGFLFHLHHAASHSSSWGAARTPRSRPGRVNGQGSRNRGFSRDASFRFRRPRDGILESSMTPRRPGRGLVNELWQVGRQTGVNAHGLRGMPSRAQSRFSWRKSQCQADRP